MLSYILSYDVVIDDDEDEDKDEGEDEDKYEDVDNKSLSAELYKRVSESARSKHGLFDVIVDHLATCMAWKGEAVNRDRSNRINVKRAPNRNAIAAIAGS